MGGSEAGGLDAKLAHLRELLAEIRSAVAAFSGGVDSSLLVAVARDVLGEGVVAVTAVSATSPGGEIDNARELAASLGLRHVEVETREFEHEEFLANTPERCYHCKKIRFGELAEFARREGYAQVIDGSNVDDVHDFRPGERAGRELGVRHPLREAGLTKAEVRALGRGLGLAGWDRPASACLASRIPYGQPLEVDTLRRVDVAESLLRGYGCRNPRVRVHGAVARIEVGREEIGDLAGPGAGEIAGKLREIGFAYVALDLEGYRTGSLNEALAGAAETPDSAGSVEPEEVDE